MTAESAGFDFRSLMQEKAVDNPGLEPANSECSPKRTSAEG
jgi:hypothetical protein